MTKSFAKCLIIIPIITGTVTTKNIFKAIPNMEISLETLLISNKSIELKTINGTDIILSQTSNLQLKILKVQHHHLANLVSTFEVTPPGAAAISITPIASSAGVFNNLIKINAIIGSKIN